MSKPVILTGIRANDKLTLGNYLGAIKPTVDLQKKYSQDYRINFFIPDLHSIITPIDYSLLKRQVLNVLKSLVAAGLDIEKPDTFVYRQSYIKAHSELTWLLSCLSYFGELSRMTQFKDKQATSESVSVGLFTYPILMASDILLYDAKYIPLGDDQRQHLELTRNIAIRFNRQFNVNTFTVPETWQKQLAFMNLQSGVRIRSLKNPKIKMSKSIADPAGTILLDESPDVAVKKINAATTDSNMKINYDFELQPGISNLLQILSILEDKPLSQTINSWQGKTNYGDLKKVVGDAVYNFLTNYQQTIKQINDDDLLDKLTHDEAVLSEIADKKLTLVQKQLGIR